MFETLLQVTRSKETRFYIGLFLVYFMVTVCTGAVLQLSGVLARTELQTINRLYEARKWIAWTPEGLRRLNLSLIDYHEEHEIPRVWWAWDYTLSWLIEPNHPEVKHKIIIFNHLLEDEPPREAIKEHPWMKPLLQVPLARTDLAKTIEFLARSGVRLIILDNDFPQYSPEDKILAAAIHRAASGEFSGSPVPVLMAGTVKRRGFANVLQLNLASTPVGVLRSLSELEPGQNVAEKYTGVTSMLVDEDQVVRQIACRIPSPNAEAYESMAPKVVSLLGEPLPNELPDEMDIDFAGPPNSELYPVRPFSYLLDPEQQEKMVKPKPDSKDVTLPGSIVILGDGVTDLHPTPFTNLGVNEMSGSEILAQAIETVSRHSWHYRLDSGLSVAYLALYATAGSLFLCLWKFLQRRRNCKDKILSKGNFGSYATDLFLDLVCYMSLVALSFLVACLLFSYGRIIVPVIVPAASLTFAAVATSLWERENERISLYKHQLQHAQESLRLQSEKHDFELRTLAAEAKAQEMLKDELRRKEFVQRINHDLKAPVTAMTWILARLAEGGLQTESAAEKVERLSRTSNRLVELLHELASSYESSDEHELNEGVLQPCLLNKILQDCVAMAGPEAEKKQCRIDMTLPKRKLWVLGNELELKRVFDNLIRNAILHNQVQTCIQIEARSRAHVHQISISDNGNGLPPEILEKLEKGSFEKSDLERGRGLGLQIVKAFVESAKGKLAVTTEPGQGSNFVLSFPSANIEAGGEPSEAEMESEPTKSAAGVELADRSATGEV